jgi:hypothetical protein
MVTLRGTAEHTPIPSRLQKFHQARGASPPEYRRCKSSDLRNRAFCSGNSRGTRFAVHRR